MMSRKLLLPFAALLLTACSDDPAPSQDVLTDTTADATADATADVAGDTAADVNPDVGPDTSPPEDASADSADSADTTPDTMDTTDTAGPTLPLPGFGAITGPCGFLDDELLDPNPSFEVNAIDFGSDPYDAADYGLLTEFGQEVIDDGNAGGSSLLSEVFAMEVLARCELATLLATETEIRYTTEGKITDLLVEIEGRKIGVSVVRAVGFPKDDPYTVEQARTILERKLGDILESSANVAREDAWEKQILHVLAYAEGHVESLEAAWEAIPAATRADTIVFVTVTNGDDLFLY